MYKGAATSGQIGRQTVGRGQESFKGWGATPRTSGSGWSRKGDHENHRDGFEIADDLSQCRSGWYSGPSSRSDWY